MGMRSRGFENLPVEITSAAVRIDAALRAPSLTVSADMLMGLAGVMESLAARVRQAADLADLQSRRPVRGAR